LETHATEINRVLLSTSRAKSSTRVAVALPHDPHLDPPAFLQPLVDDRRAGIREIVLARIVSSGLACEGRGVAQGGLAAALRS
jgi:hypothetical protein